MRVLETNEIGQVSGAGLLGLNLGLGINLLGILGIGVAAGVNVDDHGKSSCNDDRGHDSHDSHSRGCR